MATLRRAAWASTGRHESTARRAARLGPFAPTRRREWSCVSADWKLSEESNREQNPLPNASLTSTADPTGRLASGEAALPRRSTSSYTGKDAVKREKCRSRAQKKKRACVWRRGQGDQEPSCGDLEQTRGLQECRWATTAAREKARSARCPEGSESPHRRARTSTRTSPWSDATSPGGEDAMQSCQLGQPVERSDDDRRRRICWPGICGKNDERGRDRRIRNSSGPPDPGDDPEVDSAAEKAPGSLVFVEFSHGTQGPAAAAANPTPRTL